MSSNKQIIENFLNRSRTLEMATGKHPGHKRPASTAASKRRTSGRTNTTQQTASKHLLRSGVAATAQARIQQHMTSILKSQRSRGQSTVKKLQPSKKMRTTTQQRITAVGRSQLHSSVGRSATQFAQKQKKSTEQSTLQTTRHSSLMNSNGYCSSVKTKGGKLLKSSVLQARTISQLQSKKYDRISQNAKNCKLEPQVTTGKGRSSIDISKLSIAEINQLMQRHNRRSAVAGKTQVMKQKLHSQQFTVRRKVGATTGQVKQDMSTSRQQPKHQKSCNFSHSKHLVQANQLDTAASLSMQDNLPSRIRSTANKSGLQATDTTAANHQKHTVKGQQRNEHSVNVYNSKEVTAPTSSITALDRQLVEGHSTQTVASQVPLSKQRCAVVALVGVPNAGKSTLVNYLMGKKISIVSSKPQTTRTSLRGILVEQNIQLVLIDTPGIFIPDKRRALERIIVRAAWSSIMEADVVCLMVDVQKGITKTLEQVIQQLSERHQNLILVLNKIDVATEEQKLLLAEKLYHKQLFKEVFMVSALKGRGVEQLKSYLLKAALPTPWRFQEQELTDAPLRFRMAEITREQLFNRLQQELPYAFSVRNEVWEARPDRSLKIHQVIYVMRSGQKKIILGKGGQLIKAVGESARLEMSKALGCPVHLFLFVKVKEDWQRDEENFTFNL